MNDYSNFRKQVDMVQYSGKFHFAENLKQEGTNILVNGKESIDINEKTFNYRAIVRNAGVEHKQSVEDREMKFYKDYRINQGDYITYNDDIYLIIPAIDKDNPFFNTAKITRCQTTLNYKGLKNPIWFYGSNSSYGVKGVEETNTIDTIDGKIYCLVQDNKDTQKIYIGMRFVLKNNKNQIYKCIKTENILTDKCREIVLEKDVYDEKDDLINNIAYNPELDKISGDVEVTKDNYAIKGLNGSYNIRKLGQNTFTIYNNDEVDTDSWQINIENNNLGVNDYTIIETTNNSITIKNNIGYSKETLTINFIKDNIKLSIEVKFILR